MIKNILIYIYALIKYLHHLTIDKDKYFYDLFFLIKKNLVTLFLMISLHIITFKLSNY